MGVKRMRTMGGFPSRDFGTVYNTDGTVQFVQRGTRESRQTYGPSWKFADDQQRANRRAHGWSGRGRYRGRGSFLGTGLNAFRSAGRALGVKASADSDLGRLYHYGMMADRYLDSRGVKGRGNYSMNALVNGGVGTHARSSTKLSKFDETGSILVAHREKILTVHAPGAIGNQQNGGYPADTTPFTKLETWEVNPGLEKLWPHLAQSANNYQEYRVVQLLLEYVPTVKLGDFTGTRGKICLAHTSKPTQRDFLDMDEMTEWQGAVRTTVAGGMTFGVECDPKKSNIPEDKFIRKSPLISSEDKLNYDHGKIHLASKDIPGELAGMAIGEVYVTYTIELRRPKLSGGRGENIGRHVSIMPTPASDNYFGDGDTFPLTPSGNSIDLKPSYGTKSVTYTLPQRLAGRFKMAVIARKATALTRTGTNSIVLAGNVAKVKDVFNDDGATDGEVEVIQDSSSGSIDHTTITVDVRPWSGNIPNTITINREYSQVPDHVTVEFVEHNSMTDYASSVQTLVNPKGVITVHS